MGHPNWKNVNKKVMALHRDSICPGDIGNTHDHPSHITTLSLGPIVRTKINYLKKKYGLSQSAIMRILVNNLTLDGLEKKLEDETKVEMIEGD